MADDLEWLARWYRDQCDGDWEHTYGVSLETLDNPGWRLAIDLVGTSLESQPFSKQEHDLKSEVSWWVCDVQDKKFIGTCGAVGLPTIVAVFRAWAEGKDS